MSYILDALVKADLERQRQRVPGLNTVQAAPLAGLPSASRWPLAAAGLALVGGCLFLAWDRFEKGGAPAAAAPLAALPARPQAEPATKPAPAVVEKPVPAAASDAVVVPARPPARRSEEKKSRPESRLHTLAELPPALQEEARKIAVAGFAQASDADERLAIINDRAWREGEEVTKGLKVERISNDGVIFNLKGYRFIKGGQ